MIHMSESNKIVEIHTTPVLLHTTTGFATHHPRFCYTPARVLLHTRPGSATHQPRFCYTPPVQQNLLVFLLFWEATTAHTRLLHTSCVAEAPRHNTSLHTSCVAKPPRHNTSLHASCVAKHYHVFISLVIRFASLIGFSS